MREKILSLMEHKGEPPPLPQMLLSLEKKSTIPIAILRKSGSVKNLSHF